MAHPPGFEPMLASTGSPIAMEGSLGYQPKLDGWRTIVHVADGAIRVLSRPGRDITFSLPELAAVAQAVPAGTVLDGELVAGSGSAWSFYRVAPLVASRPERRQTALTFVAFDILALGGHRVVRRTFEERLALLGDLYFVGPSWCTITTWRDIAITDLLAACDDRGSEGVVAKRLGSRYYPGERRPEWIKVKTAQWRFVHAARRHASRHGA